MPRRAQIQPRTQEPDAVYGSVLLVAALMLVGIPLLMVGVVAWVVLASLAAVKASQGQAYRYPLTLRLVR